MPWLLYTLGKSSWYPMDRRWGAPQSWSGYDGEEKKSLYLLGIKPL
jgi:hypothetical protein